MLIIVVGTFMLKNNKVLPFWRYIGAGGPVIIMTHRVDSPRCGKYWCILNHFYVGLIRPESYQIR